MKLNRVVFSIVAATIALAMTVGLALAADNPFSPKKPPFKTAIVKYTLKGTSSGKEVLYVNGLDRAIHTDAKTTVFGMTNEQKTITITKQKTITQIDLVEQRAIESGNFMYYMAQEYDKLSSSEKATVRKNAEGMGQNLAGMMPGMDVKKRKGKLMGKNVEIVTVMGMTSYVWEDTGITLKTEGSLGPIKINSAATSVDTNVSLPGSAFAVPAGLKVVWDEQADQQQRNMAKQWMDNLKDPNFGKNSGKSGMGAMFNTQRPTYQDGDDSSQREPAGEEDSSGGAEEAVEQGMKVLKGLFN